MTGGGDQTRPDRIVIDESDLDATLPVHGPDTTSIAHAATPPRAYTPPPTVGAPGPQLPPVGAPPPTMPIAVGSGYGYGYAGAPPGAGLAKLGANSILSGLLSGLAGGIAGMLLAEVIQSATKSDAYTTESQLAVHTGLWIGAFGAVLGFALLAWDGITSGSAAKAFRDGGIGAGIGTAAGFVGGYLAQTLYHELVPINPFASDFEGKALLARVLAWAVFGLVLGTGVGIPGGARKVVNGLLGGTVGAAAGGLIFNRIEFSSNGNMSEFVLRFLGLTATGVGIGLAIGLVARIRRDAWLAVVAGPMAGKEFILYGAQTTLGTDYRSDIPLVKDTSVWPEHLRFVRDPYHGATLQVTPGAPVTVNGVPVQAHRLRPGDLVSVGMSTLLYQERAAR